MKTISFFLSLLVLLSTSSVTVDEHYCSDKLQQVVFKKARSCSDLAVESEELADVFALPNL